MELGEALPEPRAEREPVPAVSVAEPALHEVIEPSALAIPIEQRLALVELRPPELIEDERPAPEQLERGGSEQLRGNLETHLRELGGGALEDLDVVGHGLAHDEPVGADPDRGPDRLHRGVVSGI